MASNTGHRSEERPENAQKEVYLVGDLRIDVGQQSVSRGEAEIPLPNLSFKLLVALVKSAPNFVGNDELMARVWPGIVVSPETVSKRAALLREALGDEPRSPRYILGLRSRGYRIIAPVVVSPPASPHAPFQGQVTLPGIGQTEPASPAEFRRRWLWWSIGALALMAFIGALVAGRLLTGHPADTAAERSHTVAVLPFDNLSASANDAYLAQAIPEMLLNRLASVPELVVIARNSSFTVAPGKSDLQAIGARLKAAYLVLGSVQRESDRLRISVELLETASGRVRWSQRLDRSLQQILEVEDEIGGELAGSLAATLGEQSGRPAFKERSDNVEAYLAYLKGVTLLSRLTVAGSDAAVSEFERAVELDPHFAPAYASLYDARMEGAARRYEPLEPVRSRYQYLVDRALTIDPGSGAAYFVRAMWGGEGSAGREADFKRAAQLDPSNGRGLTAYSEFLDAAGRRDEAGRILQRALQVDPISPRPHFRVAMRTLDSDGHQVLEQKMREVLELDPDYVPALQRYGKYRWEFHGDFTGGVQLLEHAIALDPANPWTRHTVMAMYLDIGDVAAARDVVKGTEQSALGSQLLLAQHDGDLKAAYLAAKQDAPAWKYGVLENWGAGEALRDHALEHGNVQDMITSLSRLYDVPLDSSPHLDIGNYRQAFYISQLLAAQGRVSRANELMHVVERWNDANQERFGALYARRLRASIFLQEGRRDAALTELAEAFHQNDYLQWWYTVDDDPTWQPLRTDPRFQAIAGEARQHAKSQREALERLRQQGLVPQRNASSS